MAHDVAWFVVNRCLITRRIDVLSLIDEGVPTHQIKEVFGPKVSKNGYMYDKSISVEVVKSILELYKRVTITWFNNTQLDWAKIHYSL
jgi:hypothetical protein